MNDQPQTPNWLNIDEERVAFALHLTSLYESFLEQWNTPTMAGEPSEPTFTDFMAWVVEELERVGAILS